MNTAERYIKIIQFPNPKKKTKLWGVYPKNGTMREGVGTIKWHGAWRKYCFFPLPNTLFDLHCLRMIADHCEKETKIQFQK